MNELRGRIPGLGELIDWCGGWPCFHDAEVLQLDLNRRGQSRLVIHVLGGSKPGFGPRADPSCVVPPEDIVVTFLLQTITDLDLYQFSHQNVIFSLSLEQKGDGFQILLAPCYGLAGSIDVRDLSVIFASGKPQAEE